MEKDLTQSLANGLRILSLLTYECPHIAAQQIRIHLRCSQGKAYRILRTLVQSGFLRRVEGTTQYTFGMQMMRLGLIARSTNVLSEIAMPVMKEVSRLTKESVFLTTIENTQAICVAKVDSEGPIKLTLGPGTRLPLHSAASSKILMAYLPPEEWEVIIRKEGLKRFTPNTITDPEALKIHLAQIRKRGYATSDQEVDIGIRAAAAPIFDAKGTVIGGLSIAGPIHRISKKGCHALVKVAVKYANKISKIFQYSSKQ